MSYEEKVYTKLKQHYHCAQAIFAISTAEKISSGSSPVSS